MLLSAPWTFSLLSAGGCIGDYRDSVWSSWRQICLSCRLAKMRDWIPFHCQAVLWSFIYQRLLFFSTSLWQGIKLWTFIAPALAFFSQVEYKQQSDAVWARQEDQAIPDLLKSVMKRLCDRTSKSSFPLTRPYSPSGTIHASEERGDGILEKLKWPNFNSFPDHQ